MCALDLTCLDQVTIAFVLCDDCLSTRDNPEGMITGFSRHTLAIVASLLTATWPE